MLSQRGSLKQRLTKSVTHKSCYTNSTDTAKHIERKTVKGVLLPLSAWPVWIVAISTMDSGPENKLYKKPWKLRKKCNHSEMHNYSIFLMWYFLFLLAKNGPHQQAKCEGGIVGPLGQAKAMLFPFNIRSVWNKTHLHVCFNGSIKKNISIKNMSAAFIYIYMYNDLECPCLQLTE